VGALQVLGAECAPWPLRLSRIIHADLTTARPDISADPSAALSLSHSLW